MSYVYRDVIEAGDLLLRRPRATDAPEVARALDDPEAVRFLPNVPIPMTAAFAEDWASPDSNAQLEAAGGVRFVATDRRTGDLLGAVSLQRAQADRAQAETGYWVAPWARGKGVGTAAVSAVAAAGFEAGLARIELCAEWENVGSQKVALAAGFRREGVRRSAALSRDGDTRHDLITFVRLASDSGDPVPPGLPPLPGGQLTDGVVTLRPQRTQDAADLLALFTLPEVAETNFGDTEVTLANMTAKAARVGSLWLAGDRADMIILDAATGEFAGDIGFYYFMRGLQEGMIGYSLRREFRGRGFASRAADLVARWAFEEAGVARVIAGTDPRNIASQKVLERAGFEREAHMRHRLPGPDGTRLDDIQWVRLP
ncbi:RimJ/RimL family protein N-acetyltransferase [Hamadaea flava]|uniref:GNAT family N-acetyltransferase n=1 Tax=Hamadaea flava TaxID=1742688 RepID=A0ABV8M1R5_9ACTN|nr:GNAT family N-acetyltransferase [Hamadaea flava]MCP2326715.1 RimJ/RimL family protein N-acetyltransferase [Hamadaea flava]